MIAVLLMNFFVKGRHETHKDAADASASAVINGTDLECGSIYSHLEEAVKQGLITEERIDTSLRRLLKARFLLWARWIRILSFPGAELV